MRITRGAGRCRPWRPIAAGLALLFALAVLVPAAGAQQDGGVIAREDRTAGDAEAVQRLEELERQMEVLQREMRELRRQITGETEAADPARTEGELAAAGTGDQAPPSIPRLATPVPPVPEPEVAVAEAAPTAWEVGYHKGGGGFFVRSPDGDFQFRQLGYVQFVGSLFNDDFERPDSPGDFSIRRARVDWLADFYDRYQIFVEFDGGPGSVPGTSDFALVEAKLTADLNAEGTLQFVGGKFVSPFSTEDLLSSRSQDTIERYMALNSLFLLPATDVQFGAMLRGYALDRRLEVMAGVFNGNGRANDNLSDDNGDKELQLKLNYRLADDPGALKLGLGFDHSNEEAQSLELRGLTFTPWVAVPVAGTRRGVTADFRVARGPLSFRGEGLYFDFADAGAELAGGFVQSARFLWGDSLDGLQALVRLETAALDSPLLAGRSGDRLDAVTLGLNWFWGGSFRLQTHAIGEHYNGLSTLPAGSTRVEGEGWKPYLLSQLQIKF